MADYDVIVVGAGNAALAAAVSAREQGAGARGGAREGAARAARRQHPLQRRPLPLRLRPRRGSAARSCPTPSSEVPGFFAGVRALSAEALLGRTCCRVTEGRTDPELAEILIGRSYDTVRWMAAAGHRAWSPRCRCPAVQGRRHHQVVARRGDPRPARGRGPLGACGSRSRPERGVEIRYDTGALAPPPGPARAA